MGVDFEPEEMWSFLAEAHTCALTSLRRDGWPVSVPFWFVVGEGSLYVRTLARSKTVTRIRHDPRVCVLVETGRHWVELKAVILTGTAAVVDDEAERDWVAAEMSRKYHAFRRPVRRTSAAVERRYEGADAVIRVDPTSPPTTWDNAKVRLRA